jgi:hypothetical protein
VGIHGVGLGLDIGSRSGAVGNGSLCVGFQGIGVGFAGFELRSLCVDENDLS